MNRRKRRIVITLLLLLVLIGPPFWITYREFRQERLDHALIAAIKAGDDKKALEELAEGASGEARDTGEPPTFREALLLLWNRVRHPGALPSDQADDEHLPALLLLYRPTFVQQMLGGSPGPNQVVIRALLDHGAGVNDRDASGRSPLNWALSYSNDETISLLLERGANIEEKFDYRPGSEHVVSHTWATLGYAEKVKAKQLPITPLGWAIEDHQAQVVRVLLEHGANVEARDEEQLTPLMNAVINLEPDIVRLLLEHGAKVSPKDKLGNTALGMIRDEEDSASDDDIVALLRQYGAK